MEFDKQAFIEVLRKLIGEVRCVALSSIFPSMRNRSLPFYFAAAQDKDLLAQKETTCL